MKIYDAENQVIGRFSTAITKDLLKGETVAVVNCEKAVMSGNPKFTERFYLERRQRGDPFHGPHYPRTPVGLVRRVIKGMLPFKLPKGQAAYRRLKVYIGVPEEFKKLKFEKLKNADASKLKCKRITIAELSLALGAKKRW